MVATSYFMKEPKMFGHQQLLNEIQYALSLQFPMAL